ncbi:hypothetical protein QNI19_30155 [Cytophagaceae bacterium DM2B3-1]|uniref:Secreted protein n=1 Tax=Xanthocytophaga flava TaxID=3048013 RepID=A0ABT7CWC0_9BACT|nr:hypothetical protein [Xanthocytophaga flavus]MDJ1497240.1 hypothetical protein [Xanthocytophaga flavus]
MNFSHTIISLFSQSSHLSCFSLVGSSVGKGNGTGIGYWPGSLSESVFGVCLGFTCASRSGVVEPSTVGASSSDPGLGLESGSFPPSVIV